MKHIASPNEAVVDDGAAEIDASPGFHFSFVGSAAEYFRIWVVNLLLSIITLGIYSAWATVRNRRYLYGNTDLDGHRFDFHGDPLAILKGRIIAAALLLAYLLGGELHWAVPMAAGLAFTAGFPWILVASLRFRLANTSYRGLRFGFSATAGQSYRAMAPLILVAALALVLMIWSAERTLAGGSMPNAALAGLAFLALFLAFLLLAPLVQCRLQRMIMNHLHFGSSRFAAELALREFWRIFAIFLGVGFVTMAGVFVFAAIVLALGVLANGFIVALVLVYVLIIMAYLLPLAFWHCLTRNYVLSQTTIDEVQLSMKLDGFRYWWIMSTNAMAAVATLGLAIPWTKVRMMRYQMDCFTLTGNLDGFAGDVDQDPSALGDEIGEAFDIDLGF